MMTQEKIRTVLITEAKFLAFLPVAPDMKAMGGYFLAFGILTAWLAGVGRYWDHPDPLWWQLLGLGSLGYIFVMAFILWLVILPLRPANWHYLTVLTFVGMTAAPALLYAIPVEQFLEPATAREMNLLFLKIVALWRVILLVLFLRRSARLDIGTTVLAIIMPIALIVFALAAVHKEEVIIQIMAGIERDGDVDPSFELASAIGSFSALFFPFILLFYLARIIDIQAKKR